MDRLQRQRFEFKYRIPPAGVGPIRDFLRCHLELDDYCARRPGHAYPIHSLYLDTDELKLYQSTINGDRDRFKLRLRYYDGSDSSPVYFEIKRRIDQCIFKQRARVRRCHVGSLLGGQWPAMSHLEAPDSEQLSALHAFWHLMDSLEARPRSHVCYEREAWVCAGDNSIRVTFDHGIHCEPHFGVNLVATLHQPRPVFDREVVLEIKFTDRFPAWLAEMVRVFGLMQGGAAKYVDGITGSGVDRFCARKSATPSRGADRSVWPASVPTRNFEHATISSVGERGRR